MNSSKRNFRVAGNTDARLPFRAVSRSCSAPVRRKNCAICRHASARRKDRCETDEKALPQNYSNWAENVIPNTQPIAAMLSWRRWRRQWRKFLGRGSSHSSGTAGQVRHGGSAAADQYWDPTQCSLASAAGCDQLFRTTAAANGLRAPTERVLISPTTLRGCSHPRWPRRTRGWPASAWQMLRSHRLLSSPQTPRHSFSAGSS
jgi:hypothetical protein